MVDLLEVNQRISIRECHGKNTEDKVNECTDLVRKVVTMYKFLHYGGWAIALHGMLGLVLIPHGELTKTICLGVIGIGAFMYLLSLLIEEEYK